ncbi:MAG TPA: hypothetical protein VFK38_09705 [Candidatus Limnocylindrales bacterium]|nr:hypothetical protein [Candidatus Limnocylindrales bacterium]
MAYRALPPGAIRRRTMFGLLDADGWTAAMLKGLFWFVLILVLLGYIPDRAYYFTVFPTIDVGANVISPVNLCPPSNKDLPCPAPTGAYVPWEPSPAELALPQPRAEAASFQSGTSLYLIGGRTGDAATAEVLQTTADTTGNFQPWTAGPALPEPRSRAAVVAFAGVPYVIGGLDAAGKPTDTVFEGTVKDGALTGWQASEALKLPAPVSGAAAVPAATGVWLLGGRGADGLRADVLLARLKGGKLGAWEPVGHLPLPKPRADGAALFVNNFIYLVGGEGPEGVTGEIHRLQLSSKGEPATDPKGESVIGWAISPPAQSLPTPRAGAATFAANGVLYVVGGKDASGAPSDAAVWAVPSTATGDIPEWKRLDMTQLPAPRAHAATAVIGSYAFLIGGESAAGPDASTVRANLAPGPPFFRLGLMGATVPALGIKGEIGQQLGYIAAFSVGLANFALLVLIGIAFSHREQTRLILSRLTRGRIRPPRRDEFLA